MSDDIQEQIKAAVEEATAGLAAKNKELLAELKEAKKGKQIDPAEVEKLESKIALLETDLGNATKALKDGNRAYESLKASLDAETGFTSKLLLDNGLTDALVKNGVAAPFLPAVKAMLISQAKIEANGNDRVAKIGDKELNEFVKDWATSDDGKNFISAPANAGGGSAGGSSGGTGGKTVSRSSFDAMSHVERANFVKQGGKVTD
jgi:hypothetical protein